MKKEVERKQKTSACIIIGDEILTGKVKEQNIFTLSNFLLKRGISLNKIEIIPDIVDEIANTVYKLSYKVDYLFTSGGIGPTHDDKTYESIGKAFKLNLEYRQKTVEKILNFHNKISNNIKMETINKKIFTFPYPCKVITTNALLSPLIIVKNIYIFPGAPKYFLNLLHSARNLFIGHKKNRIIIYTKQKEIEIAEILNEIQKKYSNISIGSYPEYDNDNYKVMISIESMESDIIKKASNEIKIKINGFH